LDVDFNTKYTNNKLRTNAIIMLIVSYSALSDNKVVKDPGPAISGNAKGTIDELPSGPLFLKISISSIISMAKINITNAPATAND
jgi:CRISPR/Cas system CMR-associated protein Cmr1 (group 7 of RAMP superfamily)